MLKKYLFLLLGTAMLLANNAMGQSGTISGKVTDDKGEPLPFANVAVVDEGGNNITGAMTDFNGKYTIKPVPAGRVRVRASMMGYRTVQFNDVVVSPGKITFLNFKLSTNVQKLKTVVVKTYRKPLIERDNTQSGATVTSDEIKEMATRSATAVATLSGGVYSENGQIGSIRGARSEGTVYYIDGMKVRGSTALPKSAIDQVSVITGGLSAQYGDATGGVISITTRGPSKDIHGGLEFVTSHFLDPYDYNLTEFSLTGPLYSKMMKDPEDTTITKKVPIVGYFISGDLSYVKDDNPSAIGNWTVKDDSLKYIGEHPYKPSSDAFVNFLNAEFLHKEAFEKVKAKKNIQKYELNLAGKLDFRLSKNMNLTFGGSIDAYDRRLYNFSFSLFNTDNNAERIYNSWRVYGRFTQNFKAKNKEEEKKQTIKNFYYQLQVDYSKTTSIIQDADHKDNFFEYGHVGKFHTYKVRTYENTDTVTGYEGRPIWVNTAFEDTLVTFTPSEDNSDLASYTESYYNLYDLHSGFYRNKELIQYGGGLLNGDQPPAVYGLWSAPGTQYNGYSTFDGTQFRVTGRASGDFHNHEISFGFEYEQRSDRYYSVAPVGLWTLARLLTNYHISQLDFANPHPVYRDGVFQDTIWYDRLYSGDAQYEFDTKLREHLGIPVNSKQWLDIDSYDPSDLSIDYFGAEELLNNGNSYVTYYGYDHHGKKLTYKPSFEDFFTKKDDYGKFERPIAPFEPNYIAGYIQDKFAFNDLIFNIGLRVDRYDANQKVLKDMFLFYDAYTVGEAKKVRPDLFTNMPSNIGDDYVVYVDNLENPSSVVGYRSGTDLANVKWYKADGTQVTDPKSISQQLNPLLKNPDEKMTPDAFKDYEPQITPMPRISFSFPISDVALFFAHYDILSKRPYDAVRLNMIQYYYITTQGQNVINNPNLKPEKTVDYEIGFQQKLNDVSALKISGFYREMNNMAQVQYVYGAYPVDYITYTNIDFATVKGLTVTYDLRRTGNVKLMLSYTLQFADGTGSDPTTALSLVTNNQPNIRNIYPLSFDQRHSLVGNLDYRFSSRNYNGPVIAGKKIFADAGANLTLRYGTGTPYSKRDVVTNNLIGDINAARKPSRFTVDLRIDKSFSVNIGKGEGKDKKKLDLNVYLTIENLFNTLNVLDVYSTTGNPDDDGKLGTAQFQQQVQQQNDPVAYENYYMMYLQRPWMYSLPRRTRVGVSISF